MLREEVFQKATDGRPYSCFAEHYGQEYSECDAGKERAKQIAGRFFSGRRGVCFTQEGRIAGEGGKVSQTGIGRTRGKMVEVFKRDRQPGPVRRQGFGRNQQGS